MAAVPTPEMVPLSMKEPVFLMIRQPAPPLRVVVPPAVRDFPAAIVYLPDVIVKAPDVVKATFCVTPDALELSVVNAVRLAVGEETKFLNVPDPEMLCTFVEATKELPERLPRSSEVMQVIVPLFVIFPPTRSGAPAEIFLNSLPELTVKAPPT